jgi:hypothetical protein
VFAHSHTPPDLVHAALMMASVKGILALEKIDVSFDRVIVDVTELEGDLSKEPPVACLLKPEHILDLICLHCPDPHQEVSDSI